jgi:hypothetical protein
VESNRLRAKVSQEGLREYVLAGVLLHVIEATCPVDATVDGWTLKLPRDPVHNLAILFQDLEDRLTVQRTLIAWLAA